MFQSIQYLRDNNNVSLAITLFFRTHVQLKNEQTRSINYKEKKRQFWDYFISTHNLGISTFFTLIFSFYQIYNIQIQIYILKFKLHFHVKLLDEINNYISNYNNKSSAFNNALQLPIIAALMNKNESQITYSNTGKLSDERSDQSEQHQWQQGRWKIPLEVKAKSLRGCRTSRAQNRWFWFFDFEAGSLQINILYNLPSNVW